MHEEIWKLTINSRTCEYCHSNGCYICSYRKVYPLVIVNDKQHMFGVVLKSKRQCHIVHCLVLSIHFDANDYYDIIN